MIVHCLNCGGDIGSSNSILACHCPPGLCSPDTARPVAPRRRRRMSAEDVRWYRTFREVLSLMSPERRQEIIDHVLATWAERDLAAKKVTP